MYALRHGYGDLMDKAEKKALEVSPTVAFDSFTPEVYIAWVSQKIVRMPFLNADGCFDPRHDITPNGSICSEVYSSTSANYRVMNTTTTSILTTGGYRRSSPN